MSNNNCGQHRQPQIHGRNLDNLNVMQIFFIPKRNLNDSMRDHQYGILFYKMILPHKLYINIGAVAHFHNS